MKPTPRTLTRALHPLRPRPARLHPAIISPHPLRPLHSTIPTHTDSKTTADAQKANLLDREKLSPTSTEYSKTSGGGDSGAAHSDTAFDPETTGPEEQREKERGMRADAGDDPLDVSPGGEGTRVGTSEGEGGEKDGAAGGAAGSGESRAVRERKNASANTRK